MPPRWIHDAMDIIWCARSYWEIHKEKDAPSQILGYKHRKVKHEYYQKFKDVEEFIENLSNLDIKTEEEGVKVTHDLLDKMWDSSSKEEREWLAGFFLFIILNPDVLWEWAGVNPKKGISKFYDPKEKKIKIEHNTQLKKDYLQLRAYVENKTVEELLYMPPKNL